MYVTRGKLDSGGERIKLERERVGRREENNTKRRKYGYMFILYYYTYFYIVE